MVARNTTSADISAVKAPSRQLEVLGIVSAAATLLIALALWSFDTRLTTNLVGPVGLGIANMLAAAFGLVAWVLPVELGLLTVRLFTRRSTRLGLATVASTLVIVLTGCALLHLASPLREVFGGHMPGGMIGEVLGEVLRSLVGLAGAYVVCASVLLITLVLRTPVSVLDAVMHGARSAQEMATRATSGLFALKEAWAEAKEIEKQEKLDSVDLKIITNPGLKIQDDDDVEDEDDNLEDEVQLLDEEDAPKTKKKPRKKTNKKLPSIKLDHEEEAPEPATVVKKKTKPKAKAEIAAPTIVAPKENNKSANSVKMPVKKGTFQLPSLDLLDKHDQSAIRIDAETLKQNAVQLTEKLESYGVKGRVDEIHPGPVVTMYEFEPKSGTKVSKIAGLENDLALALAAQKVRIVAPIPGKARVGVELPNEDRQTVYLRDILEDSRWDKHKGALPIALGKDIAGQSVYGDLAKMPHLLVAGATGAGKSVGLNVMLISLLAKKTPEEVRMLMIDPKVVELAVFDGIPHMLLPVVTDMNKAALSLKWAVDEMERRYQLFADAGARNITTYNKRVEKVLDGTLAPEKLTPSRKGKVKAQDPDGNEILLDPLDGQAPDAIEMPEKLPFIVVVVDEFADLMMVAAKDVEACIARLAQKARAAGIHVILATQRPSVDVITGMIKANFPSRMAFKVSQREDSKTILGRVGAQNLLGRGDMLMLPPGSSDLKRVHCAYISEDEVADVCDFLRTQGKPVYDENILKPRDDSDAVKKKTDDPLFDKAVATVAQAGYCSISHVQRKLGIGYNKAANLVERMEEEGVVGPRTKKAGGRREVLVSPL